MQNDREDRAIFATTMYGIAEDFGGTLSNDNLHVRFAALQEFSICQITKAGTWLLRNRGKTFPAVPTTKEFLDAIHGQKTGAVSPKAKAGVEADKVLKTLKEWGRDAEPLFIDEITRYLVTHRWTFRKLDTMTTRDPALVWWRKEFIESYLELVKDQAAGGNLLPELWGPTSEKLSAIADGAVKRLSA